ncbi:amino acid permease 6-like [Neltuma alba]|uniref:amino acid permease 6-like n=1 Tax=Neltuma alba TaxID=207710 RepID=UPI0010A33864|nr:amino acid permease 6-like [Prosopis alba]
MAMELQRNLSFSIQNGGFDSEFDDDGKLKRTGTWFTASAHIVTAVIGSGVLSLGWAMAQLGWVAGPIALSIFSLVTLFTSCLLTECYRSPDGTRNYTYTQIVKTNLGGMKYLLCGVAQYVNLVGITIGYTITASISMAAVRRSSCFHKEGHEVGCHSSNNGYMIIFGIVEIILSQIPKFHKLSWLSLLAALMSVGYAFIAVGLSIAKVAGGKHVKTGLSGTVIGVDVTSSEKIWNTFQALGNIAFAYAFSVVIVEIQDTLKSSAPENQEMKKAVSVGVSITSLFYLSCGILGYAAFGNSAPGNILTGFGFYEPFWMVDVGNTFVVVHLVGAYQVFCQPVFSIVEDWCSNRWPESDFATKEYSIGIPMCGLYKVNQFRVIWRTLYVIFTTVIAMMLPFFNSILGLLGAFSFWPLTVYFPVEMYISQRKMPKFSAPWMVLKVLSVVCLIVTIVAAAGSIEGIIKDLKAYKPFQSIS